MRIVRTLESFPPEAAPSVVALGVFDGVHLGHRAILDTAVTRARASGATAVACTFDRHPAEILQPDRAPVPITTVDERLALIAETGMALAVVVPFTPELAAVEPEAFVRVIGGGSGRARWSSDRITVRPRGRGDQALREVGGRWVSVTRRGAEDVDGAPLSASAIRGAARGGRRRSAAVGVHTRRRTIVAGRAAAHPRFTPRETKRNVRCDPHGVYACRLARRRVHGRRAQ